MSMKNLLSNQLLVQPSYRKLYLKSFSNSSKIEDLGVRINSKSDAQYAEKINRLKTRLAAINQAEE